MADPANVTLVPGAFRLFRPELRDARPHLSHWSLLALRKEKKGKGGEGRGGKYTCAYVYICGYIHLYMHTYSHAYFFLTNHDDGHTFGKCSFLFTLKKNSYLLRARNENTSQTHVFGGQIATSPSDHLESPAESQGSAEHTLSCSFSQPQPRAEN